SFPEMVRLQQIASGRLAQAPYVASYTSSVGGFSGATNQGSFFITLKPAGQRPPSDRVANELMRRLSNVPGLAVFIQNPPSIRIGGRSAKSLYQFTLRGGDIGRLYQEAGKLVRRLQQVPLLTGVTSDLLNTNPQVT